MAQAIKDNKLVYFDEAATKPLLEGAKAVYEAVTRTFGPKGRNVIIEKTFGRPVVTRDGVTVAREVYFSERTKNMGAQLLVEASQNTNRLAGDGTTGTVALGYHLYKSAYEQVAAGKNPMDLKAEIVEDSYKVLAELEKYSEPVKEGQLKQVATVSSGDENYGRLIAEAIEHVGADGGVITERALISGVDREYVDGYFMQRGFSAIEVGRKTIEEPYVVVSSKLLSSAMDALEVINKIAIMAHEEQSIQPNQPLSQPLRIAFFGEIEGDAYNTIVANVQKGVFDGVVVKTPPLGEMGVQYLEDVAIYVGGKSITSGQSLNDVDVSYIGRADKITCTAMDTIIFGGQHSEEDLGKRVAEIKDRIQNEEIDAISEKLKDRVAKLENKIARFRIGGTTDTEKEELEYRIEDAIQASRAAVSSGVVPGGATTLLRLSQTDGLRSIFASALKDVFKQLMDNANLPADVKIKEVLESPIGHGINLRKSDEIVDLIQEGILDPTLVIEQIIKNASTQAAAMVSCDCVITFEDTKER